MTVTLVLAVAIVIALSFLLRNSERRVYEQLIAELQRERISGDASLFSEVKT